MALPRLVCGSANPDKVAEIALVLDGFVDLRPRPEGLGDVVDLHARGRRDPALVGDGHHVELQDHVRDSDLGLEGGGASRLEEPVGELAAAEEAIDARPQHGRDVEGGVHRGEGLCPLPEQRLGGRVGVGDVARGVRDHEGDPGGADGGAELALERGGHLHVGLEEHFHPTEKPTNEDLVRQAVALCAQVGRPVASGTYYYWLSGNPTSEGLKMLLLR